jgi:cytochrome c-type biogenesis protein CcmH/NrfG
MQSKQIIKHTRNVLLVATAAFAINQAAGNAILPKNSRGPLVSEAAWMSNRASAPLMADQVALLNNQQYKKQTAKAAFSPPIEGGSDSTLTEKIAKMFNNRDFAGAAKLLADEIKATPGNPENYTLLGFAYDGMGKTKLAAKCHIQAHLLAPDSIKYMETAALAYLFKASNSTDLIIWPLNENHYIRKARELAQQGAQASPNNPNALALEGMCYLASWMPNAAIADFERALQMTPSNSFTKALYGAALYKSYLFDGAAQDTLLQLANSNLSDGLNNLISPKATPAITPRYIMTEALWRTYATVLRKLICIQCEKSQTNVFMGGTFSSTDRTVGKFMKKLGIEGDFETGIKLRALAEKASYGGQTAEITVKGKTLTIYADCLTMAVVEPRTAGYVSEFRKAKEMGCGCP